MQIKAIQQQEQRFEYPVTIRYKLQIQYNISRIRPVISDIIEYKQMIASALYIVWIYKVIINIKGKKIKKSWIHAKLTVFLCEFY